MRIPAQWRDRLKDEGISETALRVHESSGPVDLHLDTASMAWLFGLDFTGDLTEWRPSRFGALLEIAKATFLKGEHKPLFGHADIPRLRKGGVAGACCSAHVLLPQLAPLLPVRRWSQVKKQQAFLRSVAESNPETIALVRTPDEYDSAIRAGKLALLFSVEGSHCLGSNLTGNGTFLERLKRLKTEFGAAYITVNHFTNTRVTNSSLPLMGKDDPDVPARPFAREFVEEANRVGIILDVSHTNRRGILDIAGMSRRPIIASHAGALEVADRHWHRGDYRYRMLHNEALNAIKDTDGCVSVILCPYYLNGNKKDGKKLVEGSLDLVVEHYNYLKSELGVRYLSFGTDFDGFIANIPTDMEDIAWLPRLSQRLIDSGWTEEELKLMYGENFLRVWRDNLENLED